MWIWIWKVSEEDWATERPHSVWKYDLHLLSSYSFSYAHVHTDRPSYNAYTPLMFRAEGKDIVMQQQNLQIHRKTHSNQQKYCLEMAEYWEVEIQQELPNNRGKFDGQLWNEGTTSWLMDWV